MLWNIFSNFLTILFLLGLVFMFYGYLIEPHTIEVTHFKRKHGQASASTLRLIQISDIHMGYHVSTKALEHLVDQVNALAPDVIFLTGDLYDNGEKYKHGDLVGEILKRLNAHYGKYAIFGNHEYAGSSVELMQNTMQNSDFMLLVNSISQVPHPSLQLYVAGADCAIYGERQPEFCQELTEGSYNILLHHQADAVKHYLNYPINLVFSGHTHGGQIAFPFIGALILPEMGKRFVKGWYQLKGKLATELYVNRGFGMTMLPFRFFSKPEITVIDLIP